VRHARITSASTRDDRRHRDRLGGPRLAASHADMSTTRRPRVRFLSVVVASLSQLFVAAADPAPEPAPAPQTPSSRVGSVEPRPAGEPVVPSRTARERELTAADVAADPVPGFETGRDDPDDHDSTWRIIGRGALFVPRLAADAVLSPFRGAIWLQDHYHVTDWYDRIFYNDAMTIGLYPTASIDTTLGVTVGARFIDKDLFGEQESLGAQATFGSRYRQIYSISLGSGRRLGDRFSLGLDVGYERRPHDAFYGIGNGDLAPEPAMPAMLIDPRFDQTAIESYYRQDRERLTLTGDLHAWRQLHVRLAGAVSDVQFGPPDSNLPITSIYDPRGLVGFDGGVRYGYGELELRWDNRHNTTSWEPHAVVSGGELAAAFAGRQQRLDDGASFWRYGVDLEKFLRLSEGPRVLIAHFHGEGVTGSRDEVPFIELPSLGGPTYLRGYALDQFRDRIAAFGSLAYEWDLSQWFSARIFTDVGRVYSALDEVSLRHLRVGYGIGIEAHDPDSFVLEGSLGSSVDGGLFLNLSFNPVYDLHDRVRRR
jgi:surface antigen Omp85-like protein